MARTLARTLSPEQRAEQVRTAWRYRQQGWTQDRIAAALQVDRSTVSRVLRTEENRLLKEFTSEAERVKIRQMLFLETLRDEAHQQWLRSCEDLVITRDITRTKACTDGEGQAIVETVTESFQERRGQTGDPALLAQARGAEADIRKIWGLDAPTKSEHSGPNGEPLKVTFYIPDNGRDRPQPDGAEVETPPDGDPGDPAPTGPARAIPF